MTWGALLLVSLLAAVWPPAGRAQDVASPVRITDVAVFRGEDGGLVFKVSFHGPPDAGRVRILVDADGPVSGEMMTGADYMLEGQVLYRYPARAQGWKWDTVEPAVTFVEESALVAFLPLPAIRGSGGWAVEVLSNGWEVENRLPESGMEPCDFGSLPAFQWTTPLQPEDIGDLLRAVPSAAWTGEFDWPGWTNAPPDATNSPPWPAPGGFPVQARLMDAATGQSEELKPETVSTDGKRWRWRGRALDMEWGLIWQPDSPREASVSVRVQSDRTRCVRVGLGWRMDLARAVWHDDARSRSLLDGAGARIMRPLDVSYGRRGRVSGFPFGVVTRGAESYMAETDPAEPRAFEIEADPAASFYGLWYDLALSSQTSNFPGQAAVRCSFRSFPGGAGEAFRKALALYYQRHPDFFARKAPACGFGRPWERPGFPRTVEFACEARDVWTPPGQGAGTPAGCMAFLFLEPWSYWLKVPARLARDEARAGRLLKLLTAGTGRDNELAAAAQVGAARRPDGRLAWQEVDFPWHTGLFLRVSAQPRLAPSPEAPLNRAMADWRLYRNVMRDAPVHGLYFEPPPAASPLDYHAAALGVAGHPATFSTNRFQPGLASDLEVASDLAVWAAAVRASGGYTAGHPAESQWVFAAPSLDLIAADFRTWPGDEVDSSRERSADSLRALAGLKPVAVLRADAQRSLAAEELARHLEWCLFRGFLPGFYSRSRGADRVYEQAQSDEAIRGLLEKYLPLIRRLAAAGWRPSGPATVEPDTLWAESFGRVRRSAGQVTVRNPTAKRVRGQLRWPGGKEPAVLLDPLTGQCRVTLGDEPGAPLTLMPHEIGLRDWFALSDAQEETDFLAGWTGGAREAPAALTNIASIRAELDGGACCNVSAPVPAVRGDRNELVIEVRNTGTDALRVVRPKVITSRAYRPADGVAVTVATGRTDRLTVVFEAEDLADDPWLEVQWELERGEKKMTCVRLLKPRVADAFVFDPPGRRVEARGEQAVIEIPVRSYSNRPRALALHWEGDHKGGDAAVELPPDSETTLRFPVRRKRPAAGEMLVEIRSEDAVVLERWFDVVFR